MAEPEIRGATIDDDPSLNWIVRTDERRGWAIEVLVREVRCYEYLPGGECHVTADGAGATLWIVACVSMLVLAAGGAAGAPPGTGR